MQKDELIIGVDLGASNVRAALVKNGQILQIAKSPLPNDKSYDGVLNTIFSVIDQVNQQGVVGIGVGVPSVVNRKEGVVYNVQNIPTGENSRLESLESIIKGQPSGNFHFKLVGEEKANMTDDAYKKLVSLGKHHCQIGDVFQIVLSRRYTQAFSGDDLNLYRTLRTINPSPYLFYFDYGSYKIFGSSPEAQLVAGNGMASVNPIAGTYRRTGDDEADAQKARELRTDPKEVAEHIMLVDLARNDLSKHCKSVKVKELKEIQYFSHVIHLVSKVEGKILPNANSAHVFADTFPAGTLSGAPKHNAMKIINENEHGNRGFYGGCIGYMSFKGEFNHAIMIRSIMSKDNVLYYQAGAGVVDLSKIESELQEVNNKLAALKKAIIQAENI